MERQDDSFYSHYINREWFKKLKEIICMICISLPDSARNSSEVLQGARRASCAQIQDEKINMYASSLDTRLSTDSITLRTHIRLYFRVIVQTS